MSEIIDIFRSNGGELLTSTSDFKKKTDSIQGILFDWDGVFNSGEKNNNFASTFSEVDSMGINLLRFSYWLKLGKVPVVGVITGLKNEAAFELSKREHFNVVYFNFKNKTEAIEHIEQNNNIKPSEVLFIYDDVLDIPLAQKCGISILVKRFSNPLFIKYVKERKYADYITGQTSGNNAIREACELIMGIAESYELALDERIKFSQKYQQYLQERDSIKCKYYYRAKDQLIETSY